MKLSRTLLISVLAVSVLATIALIAVNVGQENRAEKQEQTQKNNNKDLPETDKQDADTISAQQDPARENDVKILLSAVAEFMANNRGAVPAGWANNSLIGGTSSAPVSLEHYTFVTVLVGEREAIYADGIQLVTKAQCGEGGATVSATGRSLAVQYMLSTGPACVNY